MLPFRVLGLLRVCFLSPVSSSDLPPLQRKVKAVRPRPSHRWTRFRSLTFNRGAGNTLLVPPSALRVATREHGTARTAVTDKRVLIFTTFLRVFR